MSEAGALFFLFLIVAGCGRSAPPAHNAPAVVVKETAPMEWRGQFCEVGEPKTRWVENAVGWEMVWKMIGATQPEVDFNLNFAVVVFLGERNTGGYGVEFLEPATDRPAGTWTVRYKETPPSGFSIQALTRPYAVKLYPRDVLKKNGGGRLSVKVELAR